MTMECRSSCTDDDILTSSTSSSTVRVFRFAPMVGAITALVVVGVGGHGVLHAIRAQDSSSLYSHHGLWSWPHHHFHVDANGCSWDGDDCRYSRCCASEGSRCFVKSQHWASCNESCHAHVKWTAGRDGKGHWAATSHREWACYELSRKSHIPTPETVSVPAPAPPPATPPAAPPPAPPASHSSSQYSIYEVEQEGETHPYGNRLTQKGTSVPEPTSGVVRWSPSP